MSEARWNRIEALLDQALDLDESSLPAWLASVEPELRPELERLLHAHRAAGDFLEAPAAAAAAELVNEEGAAGVVGIRIGPYRVEREIGRGGMGVVFLAHRDDVALDVALKRLPQAVGSPRAVRAFLAERRTLARLEHPHIARLLDAGLTPGGEPYFAMEWIDGETLTRFSDAHRLDVRARLRLFLDVCRAVDYAHGQLVVHRDIKPSNVLVTGDGTVKLLDFGIAKLLDESEPGATHTVGQFMTPQYASPEQIRGEEISTTSDVYSLGALLYELLAGRPPHEVDTGTPFEVGRAILESEPPPLPEAIAENDQTVACRRTTPRRLRHQLAGDLATIVAQAMHKQSDRRYASVAALAGDIERHLDGRAVLARGDSLAYRSARFCRRHWLPLTLGVAVLGAAGAAGAFHAHRVAVERDRAQVEAHTARSVSDFLVDVFLGADPDQFDGREPTAHDLLLRGAERVRSDVEGDPAVRARLLRVLGEVQRKRGHVHEARPLLEEALALRRSVFADRDPEVIQSLTHLAALRADLGDEQGAATLAQEVVDLSTEIHGEDHPETVFRLHNLGVYTWHAGDARRAETILRRSLAERRRILGGEHRGVAHAMNALADVLAQQERHREAMELYTQALDTSRRLYGAEHVRVASVLHDIGRMQLRLHDLAGAEHHVTEALRIREQVFGDDSPRIIGPISTLAAVRAEGDELAEAEAGYLRALAIVNETFGSEHERTVPLLSGLAGVQERLARATDAEATFTDALDSATTAYGADHPEWARMGTQLGAFLCRNGRAAEALPILARSVSVIADTLGAGHPDTRASLVALADAHRLNGTLAEARRVLDRAAPPTATDAGRVPTADERARWLLAAARLERDAGNPAAARAHYAGALEQLVSFLPEEHRRVIELAAELAAVGAP